MTRKAYLPLIVLGISVLSSLALFCAVLLAMMVDEESLLGAIINTFIFNPRVWQWRAYIGWRIIENYWIFVVCSGLYKFYKANSRAGLPIETRPPPREKSNQIRFINKVCDE